MSSERPLASWTDADLFMKAVMDENVVAQELYDRHEKRVRELVTENARLRARTSLDGFVIVLTEAQAQLFTSLCTMLLSGTSKTRTVSDLRLGIGASDNLLKSLRRRFEKALRRGEVA